LIGLTRRARLSYANRGRVLTFDGVDEILWATRGEIDAGRGVKTARSFKTPIDVTDKDGATTVIEAADITGSGIVTVKAISGVDPDVDIGTPRGTVDAGDADIRVDGNLTLAALHVANVARSTFSFFRS